MDASAAHCAAVIRRVMISDKNEAYSTDRAIVAGADSLNDLRRRLELLAAGERTNVSPHHSGGGGARGGGGKLGTSGLARNHIRPATGRKDSPCYGGARETFLAFYRWRRLTRRACGRTGAARGAAGVLLLLTARSLRIWTLERTVAEGYSATVVFGCGSVLVAGPDLRHAVPNPGTHAHQSKRGRYHSSTMLVS